MKKILMVMALGVGLSGAASAQGAVNVAVTNSVNVIWEYAMYTDIEGIGQSWNAPNGIVTGKDIDAIMSGMQCGSSFKGLAGFLNCAGDRGWELVQFTQDSGRLKVSSYIFKRRKN